MDLPDLLYQYLNDLHTEKLRADPAYQAAREARNQAETALIQALSRPQRRLFHDYMEQVNRLDALELARLFSSCTLLVQAKG